MHCDACKGYSRQEFIKVAKSLLPRVKARDLRMLSETVHDDNKIFPHEVVEWAIDNYSDITVGKRCVIASVAMRGITLGQLHKLMLHIRKRCDIEQWTSRNLQDPKLLQPSTINLYDLAHYVIRPVTRMSKSSYVELVAFRSQKPDFFVSHWWGETIADFIMCVAQHQDLRFIDGEACYWVCAYANNQHELGVEVADDPKSSSFFKAMQLAIGVLLILDRSATPFTRIWCCFEESVVVTNLGERSTPTLLDIATVGAIGSCTLLTDGLTERDRALVEGFPEGAAWKIKLERESNFPLEVVRPALELDICSAIASQEQDKRRILNTLAGLPKELLDREPDTTLSQYEEINRTLRGIFAVACWRQSVERGHDISSGQSQLELAKTLKMDTRRKALKLCFDEVTNMTDKHLDVLSESLPSGLCTLEIRLRECNLVTSVHTLGQCLGHLVNLRHVALFFSYCNRLVCVTELGKGLARCREVTKLNLDLSGCTGLMSVDELGKCLGQCLNLSEFHLSLQYCSKLASLNGLGKALGQWQKLSKLELNFESCLGLTSMDEIGKGLGHCHMLSNLDMNFASCQDLTSVDDLGKGLGQCRKLSMLKLNFQRCTGLTSVDALGKGLGQCPHLRNLHLDFSKCIRLASVYELGQSVGQCHQLSEVNLQCAGCSALTSVDGLEGLGQCENLGWVKLNFVSCNGLTSLDGLGRGLAQCPRLPTIDLKLGYSLPRSCIKALKQQLQHCQLRVVQRSA